MGKAARTKPNPFKTKKDLSIFISYYRPHIKLFAIDMICALLIALIDLAFPLVSKYAMERYLPLGMFQTFFIVMAILAGAYVLNSCLYYVVTYIGHMVGVNIEADMRRDLFAHLQTLSFRFHDKNRTGALMSRVTNDLFEITELAHHGPEDLFISLISLVGSLIILFTIQWRLALVILIMLPLTILFVARQRKRMMSTSHTVKEKIAGVNNALESSLSGIRVSKAFANEEHEIEKFGEGNDRYRHSKTEYYKAMGVFTAGVQFFTAFMSLLVIAVGGFLIMRGQLNFIELVTFTLYVATFLQPIRKLATFMELYTTGIAGFKRFLEIMRTDPDITDSENAVELTDVRGDIEFENVSFSYDGDINVLENIHLQIPAGKMLAIVGPSGGGKTTLAQLIPRFYEISKGSIRIDGRDIRDFTLSSLRNNIGIVQQDVFLFADTVRENIRYGKSDATDEEIVAAAKLAGMHETIMEMPNGYDTYVGERGMMLSGGQRQRLSIARIFLKNPPILILDEATSALDSVTEQHIQESFDKLSRGRTSLVIAHRLSTVRSADEIIVITEEGIEERGTHDELIKKDGLYADLHRTQWGPPGKAFC